MEYVPFGVLWDIARLGDASTPTLVGGATPPLLARNCSPKLDKSLLHDGRDGVGSSSSVTRACVGAPGKENPTKGHISVD